MSEPRATDGECLRAPVVGTSGALARIDEVRPSPSAETIGRHAGSRSRMEIINGTRTPSISATETPTYRSTRTSRALRSGLGRHSVSIDDGRSVGDGLRRLLREAPLFQPPRELKRIEQRVHRRCVHRSFSLYPAWANLRPLRGGVNVLIDARPGWFPPRGLWG